MRVVNLRTGVGVAIAVAAFGWTLAPQPVWAQVVITQEPERASLLYSAESDQNCSDLSVLQGDSLPYNVVRLRAQVPSGTDTYQWSLPKPQVGFLLADQDLGPEETTAAVRGFCAEFGNACILTEKALKFYNLPTILYAAPTCDVLPKATRNAFDGASVTIKLTAKAGKRKLGKASATVRYGASTVASVTLYAVYPTNVPDVFTADDGIGKDSVEGFALNLFNAVETPPNIPDLSPIRSFAFQLSGRRSSEPTCPDDPPQVCTEVEATAAGMAQATVAVRLEDGSALCDALNLNIGTCPRKAQVQIIRVPSKSTYVSEDAVRLRVRFANLSPNREGCGLLLQGDNVLSCSATFKIGETEETNSDQWDLQHCSATAGQPCVDDTNCRCVSPADCQCDDCEPNEVCLLQSHCSETFTQLCSENSDCETPACPTCQDNEACIRVLPFPLLGVAPGQAVDLVDEVVVLKNKIGSTVGVKETWTANAFPGTSADAKIKYRIKTE